MWRTVFLFLVILGAMAVVFGLIFAVGVVRLAQTNAPAPPAAAPAPAPPAGSSAARVVAAAPAPVPQAIPPMAPPNPVFAPEPRPQPAAPAAAVQGPPRDEPKAPAKDPPKDAAKDGGNAIAVTGLTIIDVKGARPLGPLTDGMTVRLAALPAERVSVRAETIGNVGSVRFEYDGKQEHEPESNLPFTVNGDNDSGVVPWRPRPGGHTIAVTPYPERNGRGQPGKPLAIKFTVESPVGPIDLPAADARLRGKEVKLEGDGGQRRIVFASGKEDYVEWTLEPPEGGLYEVELTYAAAPEHGGEFVVRIGDHRFTGTCKPTGGWNEYRSISIGKLTLAEGKRTLVILKPTSPARDKPLMNVKGARLVPVM